MVSSPFAGRLADRRSFPTVARTSITVMVAGMALTLSHTLALFAVGFGLFTAAFFAAHLVISSWLSQLAGQLRSTAAALYLTGYYIGSSVAGSLIGVAYQATGWIGTVTAITALSIAALAAAATT
jgi:MFS transporter, YNFM family, putative membrane transport protein